MILQADAGHIPLRDCSVHCVVTSPPYWGLRDYCLPPLVWGGNPGCEHKFREEQLSTEVGRGNWAQAVNGRGEAQPGGVDAKREPIRASTVRGTCSSCGAWRGCLGLEPTPELYIEHIVEVFREVRRVLRDDGTLWLNLGDCYATAGGAGYQGKNGQRADRRFTQESLCYRDSTPGLKPKDMVGIPWRVAFALQADGWWLRSDVIWSKPNPMPESVVDRPTKSHEYLFLLAKSERYYYDAEAIKEPATYAGKVVTLGEKSLSRGQATGMGVQPSGNGLVDSVTVAPSRNRRSVWEISTQAYPEAHFATFPEALVEPCVLAGTSERGCCPSCGSGWKRIVEKSGGTIGRAWHDHTDDLGVGQRTAPETTDGSYKVETKGWQLGCICGHEIATTPLVLDPFAGSGTVGEVCHRLGRRFVGLELSEAYCGLAKLRTAQLGLL